MPFHIGVNALYLIPGGVGGTEIYLRSLLDALAGVDGVNRYTLFTNRETGEDLGPKAPNISVAVQPVRAVNRPMRIVFEQTRLPGIAAAAGVNALFNPGFTAPALPRCRQVTVIHDLQHVRHPEHFRTMDLRAWQLLVWAAVRRSNHLIAVSESTKADVIRHYAAPAETITVVPHGVDENLFTIGKERRTTEPFLLCVSTLHPHKNIVRLLGVFARLRKQQPELRLVLAGLKGFHADAVERVVVEHGLIDAVRITGWIPREDLYELFRKARGFVYPSTFEGFGMPVLEALAAGIPTACSDIEPLRSVAGGQALLFPPEDEEAMLRCLGKLARGEHDGSGGPQWASHFRWREAALRTLAILTSDA